MKTLNHTDSQFDQRGVLRLSGTAFVDDLEDAFDELHKAHLDSRANTRNIDNLVFDFADVTFTETVTLQTLIALTAARKRGGLASWMRLPAGQDGGAVRDYLRRWQFPRAFSDATGIPFIDFVVPDDHIYFKGLGGDRGAMRYRVGQRSSLLENDDEAKGVPRFFPFTTWNLKDYAEAARVPDEAVDAWTTEPILSILDKRLASSWKNSGESSSGTYVASRIVFEAMTNATRHPGGSLIQMSSTLRMGSGLAQSRADSGSPEDRRREAHFTVSFWDDGKSMISTLKDALISDRAIRQNYPASLETSYHLRVQKADGVWEEQSLDSTATLDARTPDCLLLLATIFPGVTCDGSGLGHRVHSELAQAEPELTTLGMGLFALVRTVVDKFGGSVAFRTADYFMNVRRGKQGRTSTKQEQYQVKVVAKPSSTPTFLGNLITVRLPLRAVP